MATKRPIVIQDQNGRFIQVGNVNADVEKVKFTEEYPEAAQFSSIGIAEEWARMIMDRFPSIHLHVVSRYGYTDQIIRRVKRGRGQ